MSKKKFSVQPEHNLIEALSNSSERALNGDCRIADEIDTEPREGYSTPRPDGIITVGKDSYTVYVSYKTNG
jgi:hypothetical protein